MNSTRLPGKVLMTCVGKPMIELLIERIRRSKTVDKIVIATTTKKPDDAIVAYARKLGVGFFRGSEQNVVQRVTRAMEAAEAEIVVQLTGDNPLVDPNIIDRMVRIYRANKLDYISNKLVRTFPIGLDVQVSSLSILQKSLKLAKDKPTQEHLYLSIYENPGRFRLFNLVAEPELCRPELRFTMDTKEDFDFICAIYKHFYKRENYFTSRQIIKFLDSHPKIVTINQDVVQKSPR